MTLQLKWSHQFQFAGYYAAQLKGFYQAEGLAVTCQEASRVRLPLPVVEAGEAEFGVSDMEVFQAYLEGRPLVTLGVIFQHSPNVILTLRKSKIHRPADLAGRKIMFQGGQGLVETKAMLEAEGLTLAAVQQVPHTWNLDDLLAGRVDGTWAYSTNEPFGLQQRGADLVQLRPIEYGVDFYGDLLFTTKAFATQQPVVTEAFRRASFRGWDYAMEHPEELIDFILTLPGVAARGVTREKLQFEAREMRNLLLPGLVDTGHINLGRFRRIADLMAKQGALTAGVAPEGFLFQPPVPLGRTWLRALKIVLPVGLGIGLLVALWILQLRRTVQARTAELQGEIQERRQGEAALLESEARYRSILQASPDDITITDLEGRILLVSPTALPMFGCQQVDDLVGHSIAEFMAPDDRARAKANIGLMLQGQRPGPGEYRGLRSDGSIFAMEVNGEFIRDAEGQPTRMVFVVRDITARKQAEEALRESEERFNTAFQFTPVALGITAVPSGHFLAVNNAFEAIYGYNLQELAGRTPQDIGLWVSQETRAKVLALLQTDHTVRDFEAQIRNKDGSLRWVSYSGQLVSIKGSPCLLSAAVDITGRKQAEETLRESEEKFRTHVENSFDVIFTLSDKGKFLFVSPAWERHFGNSASEVVGKNFALFTHPDDAAPCFEYLERVLTTGQAGMSPPYRVKGIHGDWRWLVANGTPYTDSEGDLQFMGVARDITENLRSEEQKRSFEAQLQQSQKMDSLGSLAGGVAHDMNNVLGAILALASAHLEMQPADSDAYRAFDTISKAAQRGGTMVKSLLSFARRSPAEEHEVDVNALLREEVGLLERTTLAKIRLELDLDPALRPISGDAAALTHALMNLCVNAVDAMPEQGTLTLRTRNVDADWIEVVVEDTGEGMPKGVLEKALDPFFTTKEQGRGTGLGLSMVYSTVKAHRGQLAIHSEPGQGTQVHLRFPASAPVVLEPTPLLELEPVSELSAALPPPPLAHQTLQVLLVDDDELIQSSMQALVRYLGHTVTAVLSGEEALAKLEAGFQPDVVILDMNMPGLGGVGTLPRLRALRPRVPVLLSTGRVDQSALELVAAHPHVTLLSKPFSLKELQKRLDFIHGPWSEPQP